ncbi:26S proteasome complex subunit SEM1 [Coelomomyces lativittatus]|nr:26S proteasome complex subunit SEM1 [Coelomomyces lativittatus]KAJ1514898.1 26S proteasome complex subunit SEM1 [Coelomomyces lativittatus]KAJ1514980.1 26S proteasome complex subunit SEM1 [Coelomomyces lativittatus]
MASNNSNTSSTSPKKETSSTQPSQTTTTTSSNTTGLPKLGILEEDDEFEDFPVEDWDDKDQAQDQEDVHAWDDNWDDDDVNDEFTNQLRVEFKKMQQSGQTLNSNTDAMQTH